QEGGPLQTDLDESGIYARRTTHDTTKKNTADGRLCISWHGHRVGQAPACQRRRAIAPRLGDDEDFVGMRLAGHQGFSQPTPRNSAAVANRSSPTTLV